MKAVVWNGPRDIDVAEVPDPRIEEPTDIVIRVTTSGICGSDLHLYETMAAFMDAGDVLGHEPMGLVMETGSAITHLRPGDRVVIPANIACGHCFMCDRGLQSQCETTQVREQGMGAPLYGYSKLYGSIPGGQAEYLRVPRADYGPIPVPEGVPDDRYVYLSDVLPTAWQGVDYAAVPEDGTLLVIGLGPIGDMATRVAMHRGVGRVIGVERDPVRAARARANGVAVLEMDDRADISEAVLELTGGRGADSVVEAVGMESHGSPLARAARAAQTVLPDAAGQALMRTVGVDQLASLLTAIDTVRRGGTLSVLGVYGGMADPLPMLVLFDKQVTIRMGQLNARRWLDDLLPLVGDEADPLGLASFATHHIPLADAPQAYEDLAKKRDGAVKVLINP
ncbi:MAG: alcohol dehydrogenase catalytic domain-containing protein [Candidatus Nanopelagicales bacterium]|jgi:threonine dehydrogenase-like Zn-dependent dehydrogenase|nr:alcohol dehydrogenase catalytic domain-containing protein [Candidatus Nanopelagicales bacterium]